MPRLLLLAAAGIIGTPAVAADPPAGRWKLRVESGDQPVVFLLAFSQADGKWVGDFIGSSARLQAEPKFGGVTAAADKLAFTLLFNGREFLNFDGVPAKDGKKIVGSVSQFGGPLKLTELYPSQLKKLDDPFELAREDVEQLADGAGLFDAGFAVLAQAAAKKVPADQVRALADKLAKAAGGYGPRWERATAVKLASTLADQAGLADVAVAQGRRAERMLADDDPASVQMEVASVLERALTKAGKADEAKKYAATIAKLETRDFAEYTKTTLNFPVEPFAGRKAASDRAALVEVFTGAECPPCAAVDLAFDALLKTYKPTDVILLQYHFHIPQPDPLTAPDGAERVNFYADNIKGMPTVLVNGKLGPAGGGPLSAAKGKYAELKSAIEPALEKPAAAKLALKATKGEKGYAATATVGDASGEKLSLRFVLAEERVRFAGGNGIRYHHMVVRAMPGGAKGFPVKGKAAEQSVTIDPAAVREAQAKYLDEFARTEGEFPRTDRPIALKNLKLVAFVQSDLTNEVLQAAQVDLDK